MRQITFACQSSFEKYARPSRREQFLQTMESVVPWRELEALIEPHFPKAGSGRQPVGLSIMPPRPTKAPFSIFATFLSSTTYAARYSIR